MSEKEIDAVTSLNVSISTYSKKISSLAGVDVFTSLEYLDCSGQAIGSLDVADLENLKSINASSDQLTTFTLPKKAEQLASVNLSYNQITDITFQTTYAALKELNVYGNQLTSIDLSKLPARFVGTGSEQEHESGIPALSEHDKAADVRYIKQQCGSYKISLC